MAKLIRIDTGEALEFSESLYFSDEFNWSSVTGNEKYTVGGTLIIQQAVRKGGKPITLSAPDDMAWLERWQVETLQAWADIIELKMWYERMVKGVNTQTKVSFRHSQTPVDGKPVKGFNSPELNDPFTAKIQLIEVE